MYPPQQDNPLMQNQTPTANSQAKFQKSPLEGSDFADIFSLQQATVD